MQLFDFIKEIHKKKWNANKYSKRSNFFMLQRYCSIKFPVQANLFNHLNVNPELATESWHDILPNVRAWFFPKTKKTKPKKTTSKYTPDKEVIKYYLNMHQMSMKEFREAERFFKDELYLELKRIEETIFKNKLKRK